MHWTIIEKIRKNNIVMLISSHLAIFFTLNINEKLAKDLKNRCEVVSCYRPTTSLKVKFFPSICK